MMDQKRLHEIEARCTQESPPRCRAACPFDLDVRAFMTHMAAGRVSEARKLLERHLPLPGVWPGSATTLVKKSAFAATLGGSVAMHGLELSCMLTAGQQSRPLPLPPRKNGWPWRVRG